MRERLLPLCLAVGFTTVVEGLSLSEFVPVPVAFLAGAGWGAGVGWAAARLARRPRASAWAEDALVFVGAVAMAVLAFAGMTGLMMTNGALTTGSVSGETVMAMFLPAFPIAIAANMPVELFVVPGLLVLGWRSGPRRVLLLFAAAVFLVLRVWTYVVFAAARVDFTRTEQSSTPLTAAERADLGTALHLDDPRWILNLVVFVAYLLAAYLSRVRESSVGDLVSSGARSA